jgi:pimeloyl-ACP methyl ester carboxylesterase
MENKMRYKKWVLSLAFLVLVGSSAIVNGQRLKSGPQDLSFFSTVDETDQPYAIYIPKNFDESKKYPLAVFLHGAMSNHRLGLRRVFGQGNIQGEDFVKPGFVPVENDLESTRYFPVLKDVDYIVAAPYARGTAGYQGIPEQDIMEMIKDIKSRFQIDEDRMYLTGLSMGGGGTLWNGLTKPDMWAAIAPCCPAPPEGTDKLAGNALNIPVHLFVGGADFLYSTAQQWKKLFENNNVRLDYIEYPGIGHNSWEYAYRDGFIFEWFSQFKRNLFPERVHFSTQWYKYNKAYWVTIDELTPGTLASVDAKFTDDNVIQITTNSVGALTLNLEGHSQFKAGKDVSINIDGKTFKVETAGAVSFSQQNGVWANKKYSPNLYSKQSGAEGPMSEAVESNHIYVYGNSEEQGYAATAANWSEDRGMMGRIMVFPRVVAAGAIRQSDFNVSNLVLFGTKETNSTIAKFANRLPMHLDAGAKDYGLVYIYPIDGHYMLVNSGLPWWTPAKESGRSGGYAFLSSTIESLKSFGGDFILFKDSPSNVISQGRFDNNWKLPAAEAAKMKESGKVTLKE